MSTSPAVQRLTHLLSTSEDTGRPVIDEAVDADLREVLDLVERLGQTIAALPDATANGAANLAHARAERDRLGVENRRLHDALDYQASEAAHAAALQAAQRDETDETKGGS